MNESGMFLAAEVDDMEAMCDAMSDIVADEDRHTSLDDISHTEYNRIKSRFGH